MEISSSTIYLQYPIWSAHLWIYPWVVHLRAWNRSHMEANRPLKVWIDSHCFQHPLGSPRTQMKWKKHMALHWKIDQLLLNIENTHKFCLRPPFSWKASLAINGSLWLYIKFAFLVLSARRKSTTFMACYSR